MQGVYRTSCSYESQNRFYLLLAASIIFSLLTSVSLLAQSSPSFRSAELLVRYHADTGGHDAVSKASKTVPLDLAGLAPEVEKTLIGCRHSVGGGYVE